MKRFIVALFAALVAGSALAAAYDMIMFQRDASDVTDSRFDITIPSSSQNGIMFFDGVAKAPLVVPMSGLLFSGGTLTATPSFASITGWTGTSGQCVRGDGSIASCGTARSIANGGRALSSCFQVSANRDALVSYAVDVTTTVTLGGTPEGAVLLRTYTNSGCSTGQVGVISGSSGQPTTLTVAVGQQVKGSVNLYGVVAAGLWARIETQNVSGTPTFAIRTEQQEVLL